MKLKINAAMTQVKVITFGTFDLLHVGHVRMLQACAKLGTSLTVGVSSERLNVEKKQRQPVYSLQDRMEIVASLSCVDDVFVEESLERKAEYCQGYDVFVIGDDWAGKFDFLKEQGLDVQYLPRTENISTTQTIENVKTGGTLE